MKNSVALLFIGFASLFVTQPALANAPANGAVVEGQSVPNVALGFSRADDVIKDSAYSDQASSLLIGSIEVK